MQVSEKSITQMGYGRLGSRPFLVFISFHLILRNFWAQNRTIPLLKLRLAGGCMDARVKPEHDGDGGRDGKRGDARSIVLVSRFPTLRHPRA